MSEQNLSSALVERESKQASSWLRWSRKLVLHKLEALSGGRLTIIDPMGVWTRGAATDLDVTIEVKSLVFYLDILTEGSIGAAKSWAQGRWDSDNLTGVLRLMLRNTSELDQLEGGVARLAQLVGRVRHAFNANTHDGSRKNIAAHYDIGNDMFAHFLDESMTYSSGIYPRENSTLEEAQTEKLDRLCRKLNLRPTDHLLEIGTGWGSLAIHAVKHYGCRVTSVTLSEEQYELATARIEEQGLSDRIEVRVQDYRDIDGTYDKLVSIEMIEAVGHQFLPTYFGKCASLLKPDGAMAIQAINMPDQRYEQYLKSSDFIQQIVFPGSCCPALGAMLSAVSDSTDFRATHIENIGPHYARTLADWCKRFLARDKEIAALGYSDEFRRMWQYYLCYCEAGFEERYTGTVQMLLAKPAFRDDVDLTFASQMSSS